MALARGVPTWHSSVPHSHTHTTLPMPPACPTLRPVTYSHPDTHSSLTCAPPWLLPQPHPLSTLSCTHSHPCMSPPSSYCPAWVPCEETVSKRDPSMLESRGRSGRAGMGPGQSVQLPEPVLPHIPICPLKAKVGGPPAPLLWILQGGPLKSHASGRPQTHAAAHLEHCDDGPQQGVKVLPVRDRVSRVRAEAEFAAKDVHPKDAGKDGVGARDSHTKLPTLFHSQNKDGRRQQGSHVVDMNTGSPGQEGPE